MINDNKYEAVQPSQLLKDFIHNLNIVSEDMGEQLWILHKTHWD